MFKLQFRYLSFFIGLISILSFFNIIYSYYLNLYLNLNTYYYSFVLSLIISVLFFKLGKYQKKQTIFDKILTVFFGYLLLPLILSIPFYFSIYNLTFLNFTLNQYQVLPQQDLAFWEYKTYRSKFDFMRSSTQWMGGLYFLFSIIF